MNPREFDVSRAALQCAREGNVPPATPLDRHTGRVAPATSDNVLPHNDPGGVRELDDVHPAGRRDSGWRPPPWGSGEGELRSPIDPAPDATDGLNFRSYSQTNCSSQSDADAFLCWLAEVEERTKLHRRRHEMRHREEAQRALDAGDSSRAKWHTSRAHGQRERFDRVRGCGRDSYFVRCGDCGHEREETARRCGHFRACRACRTIRANRYRAIVRAARREILRKTKHLRGNKWRGRWSEKFFTLTLRHSGDVVRDLQALPRAWQALRTELWRFFRYEYDLTKDSMQLLTFVRVIEVTASDDGHAHLHVYLLSPFLPHQLLRHLWGKALAARGYSSPTRHVYDVLNEEEDEYKRSRLSEVLVTRRGPKGRILDEHYWPVVDIETCYGKIERELVKYLIKEGEYKQGKLERIDSGLHARFYEGLEGVRTLVTSRYFRHLAPPKEAQPCRCRKCHSENLSVYRPAASPKTREDGRAP